MINYLSTYIQEITELLLKELNPTILGELRDMPYNDIHIKFDAKLDIYIKNSYLAHKSKLRDEIYDDIRSSIIEKLWCRLQVQK